MASRRTLSGIALFILMAWAGSICRAQTTLPTTRPTTRATVEETSLGSILGYEPPDTIAIDYDANHVAFIGIREKERFVVLDGKSSPPYDWVIPESLEFSPKGAHLDYLLQTSSDTIPVIDGKLGKGCFGVAHNRIFWSPDGKRTAMSIQFQAGGGQMVVDGLEGPKYDSADYPVFSPDSLHLAYIARKGKQEFVVFDGKEGKLYDAVGRLTFSPNGKHLTYQAVTGDKARLVLDTNEGKGYDAIKIGPGFSYDSSRLVAVAAQAGKLVVLINRWESPPYEALVQGDFVLSPDGKRIAYAVKQGSQQMVIVDSVAQPAFDHIVANSLAFSPDSKRFVYVAGDKGDGHTFAVIDGVRQKDADAILPGTPFFSPDSKRVAYGVQRENRWRLVVDGVEGRPFDGIERPMNQMFSPDSKRIAYRAMSGNMPLAVIDGLETEPVQAVGYIAFSPDSKHYVYIHTHNDKAYVVADAAEVAGPYNAKTPKMLPIFDDATTAHIIATKKEEFVRVKIKFAP